MIVQSYKNLYVLTGKVEKRKPGSYSFLYEQESDLFLQFFLCHDLSWRKMLLSCFRPGDKWVYVHSVYRHRSNYFVSAVRSGLPFLAFPWVCDQICVCSWNPLSFFPHHVYLIMKSTISQSTDGRLIQDSGKVQIMLMLSISFFCFSKMKFQFFPTLTLPMVFTKIM